MLLLNYLLTDSIVWALWLLASVRMVGGTTAPLAPLVPTPMFYCSTCETSLGTMLELATNHSLLDYCSRAALLLWLACGPY